MITAKHYVITLFPCIWRYKGGGLFLIYNWFHFHSLKALIAIIVLNMTHTTKPIYQGRTQVFPRGGGEIRQTS